MTIYNFIEKYKVPKKICDNFIEYYKKNKEYKNKGIVGDGYIDTSIKQSTDVTFYNNSNDENIKIFFEHLSLCVTEYIKKYKINGVLRTEIANNIQHYKANQGYNYLHYERSAGETYRQLVYTLYLNTVKDKGGTFFPFQQTTISAIKGDLIIFPADFTHRHKGIISPTEEKYIVTGWFTNK